MAERRNEIGSADTTGTYGVSETDVRAFESDSFTDTTDASDANRRSPEDIERDIERTREQMGATINEIQERFSPQYIKRQVTQEVRETARNAGNTMMDTIKENPLPAAIAGLSIAWLFMKGRQHNDYDREYAYRRQAYRPSGARGAYAEPDAQGYSYPAGRYGGYEDNSGRSMGDKAHEVRDQAKELAGDVRHRTREVAHDVRDRTREFGSDVRERVDDLSETVQRRAYRAKGSVERMMDENPMGLGAIALGIGAAIGMLLPSTDFENEFMGEKRDQIVDTAREKAEDTFDRLEHVAEKTAETVKQELMESGERIKDTVKDEAQKEGLTSKTTTSSSF